MNLGLQVPSLSSLQVTMEEQLIFGALQTLNEEACEDVLEEQEKRGEAPLGPPAIGMSVCMSDK